MSLNDYNKFLEKNGIFLFVSLNKIFVLPLPLSCICSIPIIMLDQSITNYLAYQPKCLAYF